jgi:hypothetical protein
MRTPSSKSSSTTSRKSKASASSSKTQIIKTANAPSRKGVTIKKPGSYKLTFGQYKGKTVASLPLDYIHVIIDEGRLDRSLALRQGLADFHGISDFRSLDNRDYALKKTLPTWFYDECMLALDNAGLCASGSNLSRADIRGLRKKRLNAMETMMKGNQFLDQYQTPRVENAAFPDPDGSRSVGALRDELNLFPNDIKDIGKMEQLKGLFCMVTVGSVNVWKLTKEFEERLWKCLDNIETEHGRKVQNVARWKIRTKVCFSRSLCTF